MQATAAGCRARDADSSQLCAFADCRKLLSAPLRCARCQKAVYCSKDCQTRAWKAGHKRECAAAEEVCGPERRDMQQVASGTPRTEHLLTKFMQFKGLAEAGDWPGVVALEHDLMALAREMWEKNPSSGIAGLIIGDLGNGFYCTGDYARAREMHQQHKAMAEQLGDRAGIMRACCNLGTCYESTGDNGRAIEMFEQAKAISEELGDRLGAATLCGNIGSCYHNTGHSGKALEMQEQRRAISEELGDRAGVATACDNLGCCYSSAGEYARARDMHQQAKAISEELGNRAGVATACGNLGCSYHSAGEYVLARDMHQQHKAISEELGNRRGVARACGNLGRCYRSTSQYEKAREMHEKQKAMSEELGDRAGVATACGNLGDCYLCTGEYTAALTFYKTEHAVETELKHRQMQAKAALAIGVTLSLHVRADRQAAGASPALVEGAGVEIHSLQKSTELNGTRGEIIKSHDLGTGRCGVKTATGRELALKPANLRLIRALTGPAAGASHIPAPGSSSSAFAEDRVEEAASWLKTSLAGGKMVANLHLAHLKFDAGQEDAAIAFLKDHLWWCVKRGRNWCDGCNQKRGEDAPMLTCGGCRVARFCNEDHQKMASKSVAAGGSLWTARHKDICGLLGKWRGVEKDGVSPDSLRADLLAFLRQ